MTTKQAPVAPETPTVPAVERKPFSIRIGAPAPQAMNQIIVLARQGYTASDAPVELQMNGWLFATLILGNPDDTAIAQAQEATQLSREAEEREHQRQVREEARRIVEEERRRELERQVAAAEAELQRQIAALRSKADADIAQIEAAAAAERARLK
jgi:hypothetical protein